jgi:hypothetical protein
VTWDRRDGFDEGLSSVKTVWRLRRVNFSVNKVSIATLVCLPNDVLKVLKGALELMSVKLLVYLLVVFFGCQKQVAVCAGLPQPIGNTFETLISRFGSRYCINVRPQENSWYQSPCGRFYDERIDVIIGVRVAGKLYSLPFSRLEFSNFDAVNQTITPCKLIWRASLKSPPMRLNLKFVSPFYPKDERTTLLPAFIVEFVVENCSEEPLHGELVYGRELNARQLATLHMGDGVAVFETQGVFKAHEGVKGKDWDVELMRLGGKTMLTFRRTFKLQPNSDERSMLVLACYSRDAFFKAKGYPYRFKYAHLFGDVNEVMNYALVNAEELCSRTELFERTLLDPFEDDALKMLISLAFQSYASNALWLLPAEDVATSMGLKREPPFKQWFSVLEGGGGLFNSTVDVEYNISPFYLLYWNELLEMLLDEWSAYRRGGIIRHDMGMGFVANGMSYYHDMPVEENTNFLLMLFSLWASTAKHGLLKGWWGVVVELVKYLLSTDTDGNGFPNIGTSNTINQAVYVTQHAPEQTYLAMKMAATYQAVWQMARFVGDFKTAKECQSALEKITATMKKAWLGDHYPVSIDRAIPGWDAYSIYTANGWLLPLIVGVSPQVDVQRMRIDIINSTKATWRGYSSTHTSVDVTTFISQNIWRDCIAAYLGVDMVKNARSYWSLQWTLNRTTGGAFVDSYNYDTGYSSLRYYPRGMAVVCYILAIGGISFNALERKIVIQPLFENVVIPLPQFSDWASKRIPSIELRPSEGKPRISIRHKELLEGWNVAIGR